MDPGMTDPAAIRRTMSDVNISIVELATASGLSPSHVGKQVRGDLPLQRRVQRALMELIDRRAAAALPHVARLLRHVGEAEAAGACERVWGELHPPRIPETLDSVDGVDGADDCCKSPHEE